MQQFGWSRCFWFWCSNSGDHRSVWNCKLYELLSKIIDNSVSNAYMPSKFAIQGLGETSRTSPKFCWHTETFFCDLHARSEFIDRRAERKRCRYNDLHNIHLIPKLWLPWIAWYRVSWEPLKSDLLVSNQEADRYYWAVVQESITTISPSNDHEYLRIDTNGTFLTFQWLRVFLSLGYIGGNGVDNWSDLWRHLTNEDFLMTMGETKYKLVARDTHRKFIQTTIECSFEIYFWDEMQRNEIPSSSMIEIHRDEI